MNRDDFVLRDLRGKECRAAFTIERGTIDPESRTVELAWASEAPVERSWGIEILDMSPKSVRMNRMTDGAPLLLQHDMSQQIGVVESARIDSDRRGRGRVRFSRSAFGSEIFQDVQDGIRRKVSVAYIINDAVLESRKGDVATYRVTDWTPIEISLVSVPADNSVGVGRSQPRATTGDSATPDTTQNAAPAASEPAAPSAVRDFINQERTIRDQTSRDIAKRNADIMDMGEKFAH